MAYVALYRKYRSQSFGEVIGQEAVTTTLQNALKSGRIAHAYLFHGARGCGKTSTARLLARALNCVAQDGPTPTPCGVCRLCVAIRDGYCLDVIEIDAASETGVDNVREKIIENVQYAPGEARYKVYIIDEVHDLSAKAFDALLKTLEEPPPHVVFILATTELHKVPITIRSRCQPFAFKRGDLRDLAASITHVLTSEGCTAEPEAIQALARSAEGSWRDALSLLEQVLAYSDGHVTAATVHRAIGTVGTEMLARVTEILARGQWDETLAIAGELVDSGTDVRQLLTALSSHLRDLMLISAGAKQAALLELGADRLALLAPQAELYSPPTLLAMMGELAKAERELRFTNQHRSLLENTLLRLMPVNIAADADAKPAPRPAASGSAREQPARTPALAATPSPVPKPPLIHAAPPVSAPAELDDEEDDPAEAAEEAGAADISMDADTTVPLFPTAPPALAPTVFPAVASAPASAAQNGHASLLEGPEALETPPAATSDAPKFADEVTLEVIRRAWPRVLKLFKQASPSGGAYLEKAEVLGLEGRTVTLAFADSFSRDRIQNKGRELVEKKLNQGLNTDGYRVLCTLVGDSDGGGGSGVKAPVAPMPAPPGMLDMTTLLDAPAAPVSGSARPGGFDIHDAPPPVAEYRSAAPVPPPAPADPPTRSFLTEALDIFGGVVVNSEPR